MKRQNRWIASADPDQAWKEGWGWLLQIRTIFGASVIDIVATIVALYLEFHWQIALAIFLLGTVVVSALYITRRVVIYTLGASGAVHRLTHSMRDDIASLLEAARSAQTAQRYLERYDRFHDDVADRIAEVFRQITNDLTINCAIRLAEQKNGDAEYATKGRSKNMDPSRSSLSKPIPSDRGIARYLRDKERRGVFVIEDIQQAIDGNAWHETPTDGLHDVKTLIVAPINGYGVPADGGPFEKTMLGMLYVTSRDSRFTQFHCELLMGLADLLGLTYPVVTGRLRIAFQEKKHGHQITA